MLRLRLGPLPVSVHASHALVTLLFAWAIARSATGAEGWPGPLLRSPDDVLFFPAFVLAWAAFITGSVLVHELGHALAARAFGYAPTIHLAGLGGVTRPGIDREPPWLHDAVLTLAGPAFSLGLALACGGTAAALTFAPAGAVPPAATYFLRELALLNLVWGLVNLIPVLPLDGGRVVTILAVRLFGRSGYVGAQLVGLGITVALVAVGFAFDLFVLALFAAVFFVRSLFVLAAWRRGAAPSAAVAHPLTARLEAAEAQLREGRLDEAERAARTLLDEGPPALLRERLRLLLAAVTVQRGDGAQALELVETVRRDAVPPALLASALELAGDDRRAAAAWEEAARASPSGEGLLELTATLLRLGKENEARRIGAVRLARAWSAAHRVYARRGELELAAAAAESAFREAPSASFAYEAACAWARSGDGVAALRMLRLAAQNGFREASRARGDAALAPLRDTPEFRAWLASIELPGLA